MASHTISRVSRYHYQHSQKQRRNICWYYNPMSTISSKMQTWKSISSEGCSSLILGADLPSNYQCLFNSTNRVEETYTRRISRAQPIPGGSRNQSPFFIFPLWMKIFNSLAIKNQGVLYVFQAFQNILFQILETMMNTKLFS